MSGVKITASSCILNKHEPGLAVDNNPDTFWHVSLDEIGTPAWLKIDFGKNNKRVVNYIRVKPRKDQLGQDFSLAVFTGSNNGKEWEKISSIVPGSLSDDSEWVSHVFPNEKAFRFYNLNILSGHTLGNFYSIAEIDLGRSSKFIDIDLGDSDNPLNLIRMELNEAGQLFAYVVIQGGNDNFTWHEIATFRRGVDFNNINEPISLVLQNDKNYRYYRLIINGHDDNERNIIKGLELYGGLVVTDYSHNSFDIDMSCDKAGFLYWADGYDKWWRAYVNEKRVPVYRANINFKAIPVKKGENRIRFEYDPVLFKIALMVFYGVFFVSCSAALVLAFGRLILLALHVFSYILKRRIIFHLNLFGRFGILSKQV